MCFIILFDILPQIFITSHKKIHEKMDTDIKRRYQCHKN